jgi:serine kinase of HPr protein (carbohydrate metabolism regulator)
VGDAAETHHGTAIALAGTAVLIRGPSGSGKSDLALRCLALAPTALTAVPAMLVADDYVTVTRTGDKLVAEAPATIRGKLEVRGLGIVTVPCLDRAELVLVADLVAPERIERLPDPAPEVDLAGVKLPLLHIAPFEASAPVKLLLALAERFRRSNGSN